MASTGFWPVKSRLKEVIHYAENPDKTIDKKFLDEDLWSILRYIENEQKTDRTMYVSGINCPKQRAYQCMMATKRRYGKLGGNVAYHGYQSFINNEVTPAEAHKIGVETAKRMWGDEYEIVVTTHLNTDNINNHFVVNSVSFKTGRKFENHIRDHIKLREISDAVCIEHDKSIIPFTHFYSNKKTYWMQKSGKLTHRNMLRRDIDEILSECRSLIDMEYHLKTLGYRLERRFYCDQPSVIADGWKRAVRISSLGEHYSTENIEVPEELLTSFAKALAPEIRKFYDSNEGKAYYEKWLVKHPEYIDRTPDANTSGYKNRHNRLTKEDDYNYV